MEGNGGRRKPGECCCAIWVCFSSPIAQEDMSLVDLYYENPYDEIMTTSLEAKIAKDKKRRQTFLGDYDEKHQRKPSLWKAKKPAGKKAWGNKP